MTGRDRFAAVVAGQPVDHPPVGAWVHFGTALADPEVVVRAHLELRAAHGFDYVKAMHDYRLPAPDVADVRERVAGFGALGTEGASLDRQRAVLDGLRAGAPDAALVESLFSPFQTLVRSLGNDGVRVLRADPGLADEVLGRVAALLAGYVAELPARGVDALFLAVTGASTDWSSFGLTPEEYAGWVAPHDRTVLEAAAGPVRIAHLHGDDLRLDLLADHPHEVTSWSDAVSAPRIADVLAAGRVPMLGLDERLASYLSDDEVTAQVHRARREAGDRLVVAPNCTLHSDTNPHVLAALVAAARDRLPEGA